MGAINQFACASLVAAFLIALVLTANLFVASRASKIDPMSSVQDIRIPF